MREGWEIKRLGEVVEFRNGLWKGKTPPFTTVGVIRSTNFTKDGLLDYSDMALLEVEASQYEKKSLSFGDILLEKSGGGPKQPVGRVVFFDRVDGEYSFSNFTASIRVKDREYLNSRYLHYLLFAMHALGLTESMQSNSTNIRNLKFDLYKSIAVPIPTYVEQTRIVAILDEAFAAIAKARANAEQNLKNARELFESYLEGVFAAKGEGWVEKRLGEICTVKHGWAFQGEYFVSSGEFVLLTPGNFFEKGGYRDRGDKQKYYAGEFPAEYMLGKGDLLVAMTEQAAGLLGSPILVPDSDRFLHNQRLGLVVPKSGIPWANEFFFHVFNLKSVRKAIHDSGTGVKVRHTSPTKIGEVVVAFPNSVSEQESIVHKLNAMQEETKRLEAIYQQKIAALEELKKAILQKAFRGELTSEKTVAV